MSSLLELTKIHFTRWTGSQAKGGASGKDEPFRDITAAHLRQEGLNTAFTFAFVTADGHSRVLSGTRPARSGKGATIHLDGVVVSDEKSEITYRAHLTNGSVQFDFKFTVAGKPVDLRFDGHLI